MDDYLFRGELAQRDPEIYELTEIEAERQFRRLILIPSESTAPLAVRQALASAFHNIYAEGYPPEKTRWMREEELLDYEQQLGDYRRYSDPRYYKGVEYADIVEALARRRCAELFAANGVAADDLYVNVQALSGGPANNAVYHALLEPGDTFMGMDLLHGGHLSHGSPVNRSGKYYHAVHYTVDAETGQIDYEAVEELARTHRPKFIIAGYSSYPWTVNWARFRAIADAAGAYLFADIAHVAGLVAAGAYPTPIGYADVITFTTHKSLCGPRGACILTTNAGLARKLDRAVFPGEQGGPHVNVFAAMAVAFSLARQPQFHELQHQIVRNCTALTERLKERGLQIAFGGTNTHLTNLDCKTIRGPDGEPLSGDMAARILDLVGIVVNRNTIPGDRSAANPSGIRMGTPWVTQRGLGPDEMVQIADIIADVLTGTLPYRIHGRSSRPGRAKIEFDLLQDARLKVRELAQNAGIDFEPPRHSYPHFYYVDDSFKAVNDRATLELAGERVRQFLHFALSSDVEGLQPGEVQPTRVNTTAGSIEGTLACQADRSFYLSVPANQAGLATTWLRDLSDGYTRFDPDYLRKIPGPIRIQQSEVAGPDEAAGDPVGREKPYFVGIDHSDGTARPEFDFRRFEVEPQALRRTTLYDLHRELGAKMVPFAGWEMPVWYTSVKEEHAAVRQAAGVFDVTHMGVYQVEGSDAAAFLDSVCGNDIALLAIGESLYTHFLDPDANVIDDLLVYRRAMDIYLMVVNAANDAKDWAWLNAVRAGQALVDRDRPWSRAFGRRVRLRNLKDPAEGSDQRVDIALQGPKSREVLLALGCDDGARKRILRLRRGDLTEAVAGGFDLVISRTGYTGERMAFELFVHPDQAAELFRALLEAGSEMGVRPCGLGARDSLRTEAGLPLYGHEMGGELNLGVGEAGFGGYVKTYKPWFIGRRAFLNRETQRTGEVVRFRFNETGVRMAHLGDPVVDRRGRRIGTVTSCAVDSDGFLTGQAFLEIKFTAPGTEIGIFQSAEQLKAAAPAELEIGKRIPIPSLATVTSRFLK